MSRPELESKDSDAALSPPLLPLQPVMKYPAPREPFVRTLRGKVTIGISTLLAILIALSLGLTLGLRARDKQHSSTPEDAAPSSVVINLSSAAPSTVASLDPSLVSFSIEQDRWTDWAGIAKPNQFVLNVLGNLKNKTGSTPWIRIGADSEDRTMFNASLKYSRASYEDPSYLRPYPESTNITVGPAYYSLVSHLPPNTQVVFGVNLGANDTLNALNMAKSIFTAFDAPEARAKSLNLTFIEVGNEGDLYNHNGLRDSSYSPKEWIEQWTHLASNLSAELVLLSKTTRFWGPSFAFSGNSNAGWSPKSVLNSGLRSSPAGQLMQTISQHHYSGSFCFGGKSVAQDLMLKANVRSNLSAFIPDISAAHQQKLDYVLGETNSISCHGAPGVSDSAAAALWHVDYSLFAATLGIKRLFFHEGVGYKYSLIQPAQLTRDIEHGTNLTQPLPPHVQPQYYGALVVADVIGTSGGAAVVEINIPSHSYLSGYAIYENKTLKRAVFIYSRVWTAADDQSGNTRPSTQLSFSGLTSSQSVTVRRLAVGHSDDTYPTANITWAGVSYNSTNGLPIGNEHTSSGLVSDGVSIAASEVVMLSFS